MSNLWKPAFKDERRTKALIGLSLQEFHDLSKPFEENFSMHRISKKKIQKRAPGGGRKHTLSLPYKVVFHSLLS
jgi:hypothetical protein